LKEHFGKGPTEAKTFYEDDLVVCLFRGISTRVERTLKEGGYADAVLYQRMAFHELMRDRFKEVVEDATGRRVISVMGDSQSDPDMCCEVFVLAPADAVGHAEVPETAPR
jgi:uncharacterized protein YbcI